jgi:hypothetical protein
MGHSRGMRAALVLRRMRYSRVLLACILAAIVVITALVTALASFAAHALPAAAMQQLTSAHGTAIAVNLTSTPAQAGPADRVITSSVRQALAGPGFGLQRAVWSDPLNLPSPPDGSSIWTAQVASMDGVTAHTRLLAGSWPAAPAPGQPVGVAIPVTDAGPLHMAVGQTLKLADSGNQSTVRLHITGIYRVSDPGSEYWGLDLLPPSGISVQTGFRSYGPFIAQPGAFRAGQLIAGQRTWLVVPALSGIQPGQMPITAARVQVAANRITQFQGQGGLSLSTSLPQVLTGIATSYDVARSLLVTSALELLLVAAAALALTARLLASQRTEESALLEARGVTRPQIILLALAEALLLVVVAAAAGAVLGTWLARPLESSGVVQAGRLDLAGAGAAAWWPALIVVVLALLILAWPAVMPGEAAGAAARKGRQSAIALVTRAGADLALVALAVVTGWQLRRYSVLSRSASGSLGIDPVLIVAPPLILLGAALIPLRLAPALARLGDRLSARGRRLVGALASWEISRRPMRQAGPVLLAILAVGTGTLALAQQQSWSESVRAQAAAAVGADVRVSVQPPAGPPNATAVLSGQGVTAMPVSGFDAGFSGSVVALDARTAARVVQLRPDQAGRPASSLWRLITPARPGPGITIPGRPERLAVIARMSAAPSAWNLGPLQVTLSVQAADGVGYALPAGALLPDGRGQILTADVPAAAAATGPLRLLGLAVTYQMPESAAGATAAQARHEVTLTIAGFSASARSAGSFPAPFAAGSALDHWHRGAVSSTLATNLHASGKEPAIMSWQPAGQSGRAMTLRPGYGQLVLPLAQVPLPISATVTMTAGYSHAPLPAVATTSFLASDGDSLHAALELNVGSYHFPVIVVAAIKSFPTAGPTGVLIVDQSALQAALAAQSAPPLPVTSWWLSTPSGQVPGGIPASQVTSLRHVIAQMQANPLAAAPQRAVLALIIAVALLALLGFSVSVAASLSERRARSALLAALGVTRTAQARQLCLEQLLLALPAAAAGLVVGTVIAHLLVPAVTITDRATLPVPPALVYVPAGWAIALAALVAATPVLAAAITVLRKPDPAAELRAAAST